MLLEQKQCRDVWYQHQRIDKIRAFPDKGKGEYGTYINHDNIGNLIKKDTLCSPPHSLAIKSVAFIFNPKYCIPDSGEWQLNLDYLPKT